VNPNWTGRRNRATVFGMVWTRRAFVVKAAKAAAVLPAGVTVACSDADDAAEDGSGTGSTTTSTTGGPAPGSTGVDATTAAEASTGSSSTGAADQSSTSGGSDGSSSSGGDESESSTGAAICEPTPEDIEGPFYRPDIPIGGDLDVHGDVGVPLRIEGRVLDDACAPLQDAIVEIWHATPVAPQGEPGDVDATYDDSAEFRYYGQVATDAEGNFAFDTLRPGWYLNGPQYRPAHVHAKVWVRGEERLTTQLYFDGDPFNDGDAWFNPVMALVPDRDGVATIDFVV
jgi:protocatechuate 3,4-dioxygenase beta subunit